MRTGHRKAAALGGASRGCPFPPVHLHILHFQPQWEKRLMRNSFVRQRACLCEGNPASRLAKLGWSAGVERFEEGLETVGGECPLEGPKAPSAGCEHGVSCGSDDLIPLTVTSSCFEYRSCLQ